MTDEVPEPDSESKMAFAFNAHAALVRAEKQDPHLKDNPFWTMLRQDAYERFHFVFGENP